MRDVNPNLAIFNIKTMNQVVTDSLWQLNLFRWLIGLFSALALVLAAIGLFGVISFGTASRVREFAVPSRSRIRARPPRLHRGCEGVTLAAGGITAGVLIALAVTPSIRRVSAALGVDPATYAAVAILLIAIALVASVVPALRVARIDPAAALRHE